MRLRLRLGQKLTAGFSAIFFALALLVPGQVFASAYGSNTYDSCSYQAACSAGSSSGTTAATQSSTSSSPAASSSTTPTQTANDSGQLDVTPSSPTQKGILHGHNHAWWFFLFLILLALILFIFLLAKRRRRKDDPQPPASYPPVTPSAPSGPSPSGGVTVG